MPVTVKLNYLRIAPRKVREVADLIRGRKVGEAQTMLEFLVKKSARPLSKLLKSAIAAAKNDFQLEQSNLYISQILVSEGPKLKRWLPASRGRVSPIMKRTSHITLVLEEIEKKQKKVAKAKKSVKIEKAAKPEKAAEKPKFKPSRAGSPEKEIKRPAKKIGLKKMFQRKAF